MGDSVTQWRARIGRFVKGRPKQCKNDMSASLSGITCNILCAALIITLLAIGNIEKNPGPTKDNVEKKFEDIMAKLRNMEPAINKINEIATKMSGIENSIKEFRSEIKGMQAEIGVLKEENSALKKQVLELEEKQDYAENQSKRCNLVFYNIENKRAKNPTWEECEQIVSDIITKQMQVEVSSEAIERAHVLNKRNNTIDVVVKFLSYKKKTEVLRARSKLKGTHVIVEEHFSKRVVNERKILSEKLKSARQEGKYATMTFDKLKIDGRMYKADTGKNTVYEVTRNRNTLTNRQNDRATGNHAETRNQQQMTTDGQQQQKTLEKWLRSSEKKEAGTIRRQL